VDHDWKTVIRSLRGEADMILGTKVCSSYAGSTFANTDNGCPERRMNLIDPRSEMSLLAGRGICEWTKPNGHYANDPDLITGE
jgi:hypothetical protein